MARQQERRGARSVACLACGGCLYAGSRGFVNPAHGAAPVVRPAARADAATEVSFSASATSSSRSASSMGSGSAAVGLLGLAASVVATRHRSDHAHCSRTLLRATDVKEKVEQKGPSSPQEAIAQQALEVAIKTAADSDQVNEVLGADGCRISYVSKRRLDDDEMACEQIDDQGLPLVYSVEKLEQYWDQFPGELTGRWGEFLSVSTPWLTSTFGAFATGQLEAREEELAQDATNIIVDLGPTFIKLGQVLSIRPDILPPKTMRKLEKLQDAIPIFPDSEARAVIEEELGKPIEELFSEFSEAPIAAASLAQVYRAKIKSTGEEVAVKVQRPGAQTMISKDLYVMRKAAGVVTALFKQFTPNYTDYVALVETFGDGLYTELDFKNEAMNQITMDQMLTEKGLTSIVRIPKVYNEFTTRRVMVSEWANGTRLTDLEPAETRALIAAGQEVFLTQLLDIGYFHGDPHPGNLLKDEDTGGLVMLDFGLVAVVPESDREGFVSAIIHVGTKNWEALVDDFIQLQFLPEDCDKSKIIPVMQRVLTPYLSGGGASSFNFQALSGDLLAATFEIPFSLPPYVPLLARSVATLEGIALAGNPQYQLVGEAYPYVVRKLLRSEGGQSAEVLRSLLFDESGAVKPTRLATLLNAAVGVVASDNQEGFIDFDAVPTEQASQEDLVEFLLSPQAQKLRPLLTKEFSTVADLVVRNATRRAYAQLKDSLTPKIGGFSMPAPPAPPLPVLTPSGPRLMGPEDVLNGVFPKLKRGEELYLQDSAQLTLGLLGVEVDQNRGVDVLAELSPQSVMPILQALFTNSSSRDQELRDLLQKLLRGKGKGGMTGQKLLQEWMVDIVGNLQGVWDERIKQM